MANGNKAERERRIFARFAQVSGLPIVATFTYQIRIRVDKTLGMTPGLGLYQSPNLTRRFFWPHPGRIRPDRQVSKGIA